jgi:hypothetical protein
MRCGLCPPPRTCTSGSGALVCAWARVCHGGVWGTLPAAHDGWQHRLLRPGAADDRYCGSTNGKLRLAQSGPEPSCRAPTMPAPHSSPVRPAGGGSASRRIPGAADKVAAELATGALIRAVADGAPALLEGGVVRRSIGREPFRAHLRGRARAAEAAHAARADSPRSSRAGCRRRCRTERIAGQPEVLHESDHDARIACAPMIRGRVTSLGV